MAITRMRFVQEAELGRAAPTRICGVTDRSCGVRVDRPSIDNLPPALAYCSALRRAFPGRAARGSVSPRKRWPAAGPPQLTRGGSRLSTRARGGQPPTCPSLARGPLVLGLVKEQAIGLRHLPLKGQYFG